MNVPLTMATLSFPVLMFNFSGHEWDPDRLIYGKYEVTIPLKKLQRPSAMKQRIKELTVN